MNRLADEFTEALARTSTLEEFLKVLHSIPKPPPPPWVNGSGHPGGKQDFLIQSSDGTSAMRVTLTVVPNSILDNDFGEWQLCWKAPYPGACRDVMRANGSLSIERAVKVNVTRKTFLKWRLENPRFYITEREVRYWSRLGRLELVSESQ